jgi:hypothetical protein
MFACVEMYLSGCGYVGMCVRVGTCAFGRQVPMVGKGVVEAVMATLAAVQGGGAPALPVQEAACTTLQNLTYVADNKVRMRGLDRPGCEEYAVRC